MKLIRFFLLVIFPFISYGSDSIVGEYQGNLGVWSAWQSCYARVEKIPNGYEISVWGDRDKQFMLYGDLNVLAGQELEE